MSIGSEIMEEYYDREIIPPLKNLIKLQKEYIEFLGEELSKSSVFVSNRAYEIPIETIDKGIELRSKIERVEEMLKM